MEEVFDFKLSSDEVKNMNAQNVLNINIGKFVNFKKI